MVAVLLVPLMSQLQLVSVSYMASTLNLQAESLIFSVYTTVITCPLLTIPSNGSVTYKNSTADENGNYAFDVVATYTAVSLGFLWLVTTRQLAQEMAVALMVPSMAQFQSVKVDYNYAFIFVDLMISAT